MPLDSRAMSSASTGSGESTGGMGTNVSSSAEEHGEAVRGQRAA